MTSGSGALIANTPFSTIKPKSPDEAIVLALRRQCISRQAGGDVSVLRCLSRYAFLNFDSKIGNYIYCLLKRLVK